MIIRPAQADDAAALCDIANAIIRDTLITFTTQQHTMADMGAKISNRDAPFLVAELAGQVAGFARFGPFRSGPGYGFVKEHTIQLAPPARGQGAGRALMQALEQVAQQDGVRALVAGISGANPGAVAFHAKLGFVQVAHMPGVGYKQGQWLDLILMQKSLPMRPEDTPDSAPTLR